jgi:cytochrome b561
MSRELWRELILWSGRIAVLTLILNFTTCFVMPWARNKLPWFGSRPGTDQKDRFGHFQFTATHKIFAWATIVFVAVHIITAILASHFR